MAKKWLEIDLTEAVVGKDVYFGRCLKTGGHGKSMVINRCGIEFMIIQVRVNGKPLNQIHLDREFLGLEENQKIFDFDTLKIEEIRYNEIRAGFVTLELKGRLKLYGYDTPKGQDVRAVEERVKLLDMIILETKKDKENFVTVNCSKDGRFIFVTTKIGKKASRLIVLAVTQRNLIELASFNFEGKNESLCFYAVEAGPTYHDKIPLFLSSLNENPNLFFFSFSVETKILKLLKKIELKQVGYIRDIETVENGFKFGSTNGKFVNIRFAPDR